MSLKLWFTFCINYILTCFYFNKHDFIYIVFKGCISCMKAAIQIKFIIIINCNV